MREFFLHVLIGFFLRFGQVTFSPDVCNLCSEWNLMIPLLTVSETFTPGSLGMEKGPVKICHREQQDKNWPTAMKQGI